MVTVMVLSFSVKDEELSHDVVGGGVVDLGPEEDDAFFEEFGVGVGFFGAVGGLLDKGGEHVAGGG